MSSNVAFKMRGSFYRQIDKPSNTSSWFLMFSWLTAATSIAAFVAFDVLLIGSRENLSFLPVKASRSQMHLAISVGIGSIILHVLLSHFSLVSLSSNSNDGVSVGSALKHLDVSAIHTLFESRLFHFMLDIVFSLVFVALAAIAQFGESCSCASGAFGYTNLLYGALAIAVGKLIIDAFIVSTDLSTFLELRKMYTQASPNMKSIVLSLSSLWGMTFSVLTYSRLFCMALATALSVGLFNHLFEDACKKECPNLFSDSTFLLYAMVIFETLNLILTIVNFDFSKRHDITEVYFRVKHWIAQQNVL